MSKHTAATPLRNPMAQELADLESIRAQLNAWSVVLRASNPPVTPQEKRAESLTRLEISRLKRLEKIQLEKIQATLDTLKDLAGGK